MSRICKNNAKGLALTVCDLLYLGGSRSSAWSRMDGLLAKVTRASMAGRTLSLGYLAVLYCSWRCPVVIQAPRLDDGDV
jgi:hypothetical protein